jgi:hypothetical protein
LNNEIRLPKIEYIPVNVDKKGQVSICTYNLNTETWFNLNNEIRLPEIEYIHDFNQTGK